MKDTNQHFITKAYLDRFVVQESEQRVLYPYRKGGSACRPRGTKGLGCALNFYRQKEDGIPNDKLDDARTHSETLLFSSGKRNPSSFAKCVFDDGFIPSQHNRLELAAAAAFLWCGSPVQIHNVAMQTLLSSQIQAFNRLATKEAESFYNKEYGDDGPLKLEADREKFLKGDLFVDVGRENWKQLGFSSFLIETYVIDLLMGMQMTIVDCHYKCVFATSDNPVVRTYPTGYGKHDDEVWFPVSCKRGILWHRGKLGTRMEFGYSQSCKMNRRLIKHAHKFVYSPRPDSWLADACRVENHDVLWGHYGSLEEVISQARGAVDSNNKPYGEIVDLVACLRSGRREDVVGL